MRPVITILAVLASLALPVTAHAEDLSPTTEELAWARGIAVAYWHVPQPSCGRESVAIRVGLSTPHAAEADTSTCTIGLAVGSDWRDFPVELCRAYVHEFGHLTLGLDYFAATNPTDPAHSPDPASIMFSGAGLTSSQVEAQEVAVGCVVPPRVDEERMQARSQAHAARRHHRR